MFYHRLRYYNWMLSVFGVKKPFLDQTGKPCKINAWNKFWAVILLVLMIIGGIVSQSVGFLKIKNYLKQFYIINEVLCGSYIILSNLIGEDLICINIYQLISKILRDLKVEQRSLKLVTMKIGFFFAFFYGLHAIVFIYRYIVSDVYKWTKFRHIFYITLFVNRSLIYATAGHLFIHMSLILAFLRALNQRLSQLVLPDFPLLNSLNVNSPSKSQTLKYVLWSKLQFDINHDKSFNVKFLCKIYDDLGACIQLLEICHGFHILQLIWISFSSAVMTVTLRVTKECNLVMTNTSHANKKLDRQPWSKNALLCLNQQALGRRLSKWVNVRPTFRTYLDPWLAVLMCGTMFCHVLLGCYIDDQLRKEVECTERLLVTALIDFRCDPARKNTVQIFKQVVNNNRLQFTACSLFRLNYAMVVGMVINIITYSIISIQLLLSQ